MRLKHFKLYVLRVQFNRTWDSSILNTDKMDRELLTVNPSTVPAWKGRGGEFDLNPSRSMYPYLIRKRLTIDGLPLEENTVIILPANKTRGKLFLTG